MKKKNLKSNDLLVEELEDRLEVGVWNSDPSGSPGPTDPGAPIDIDPSK